MTGSDDAINHAMATSEPTAPARGALVAMQCRRLRRAGIAAAAVVVGLITLRLWWGFEAHRRLDAAIERYRQNGQPVLVQECDAALDAVPDEQNAAVAIEGAIGAIVATASSGESLYDFFDEPELIHTKFHVVREMAKKNSVVLAQVGEGLRRPRIAWSHRYRNVTLGYSFTLGSGQRMLIRLLWLMASYHYETGDHAEAIATVDDSLAISDAVARHPTIIANLVAWACYGITFSWIEKHVADIQVDDTSRWHDGIRAASRQQVHRLIQRLLDDEGSRTALVRAFYGDRAYELSSPSRVNAVFAAISRNTPAGSSPPFWGAMADLLTEPLITLDSVRAAATSTAAAEMAGEACWPNATRHAGPVTSWQSPLRSLTRPLSDNPLGKTWEYKTRPIQIGFRLTAQRRMAATALAIRLYELDHGQRPQDLPALVPDHLPFVPIDPFSPKGESIGYRPLAERPLLYSVGENGIDEDGDSTRDVEGLFGSQQRDYPFLLDSNEEANP